MWLPRSLDSKLRRLSCLPIALLVPTLSCANVAKRHDVAIHTLTPGAEATNPSTASNESTRSVAEPVSSASGTRSNAPLAPLPAYFDTLVTRASALAAQPPREPRRIELPRGLRGMEYDAYRSIRFRPERSLFRGEPGRFEVQLFHPGFFYQDAVDISVIGDGGVTPVPFSTALFSYDLVPAPPKDAALAFTGFRLHAPINTDSYKDEVVVFQGASYFRPLGKGTVYGVSARGLAIDFAEPSPEEFPRFSEFFIVRPGSHDDHVWVLALLESRRATGAYAFRILPGELTRIEVSAELFVRAPVASLGVAPITSMYLFGEEGPNRFGDFRPEVHDSDGLSFVTEGGEWLFRPLRNPPRTTVCSFRLDRPRGFGLVQRDRNFASYQDLEARYHDRPNIWVEPVAGFEHGSVRLLEIATRLESDDNVAIAYVPDGVAPGRLSFRYRLHVGRGVPIAPPGRVVATRIAKTERGARFLVDFSGQALHGKQDVQAVVSVADGRVIERHVEHNPFLEGYRASFEVVPDAPGKELELRAFLRSGEHALTETWSYLWQPTQ